MAERNKELEKEWHSTKIEFIFEMNKFQEVVEKYKAKRTDEGYLPDDTALEIWGFTTFIKDVLEGAGLKVEQGRDLIDTNRYIIIIK